jgi:hypothetical protein
MHIYIGFRKYFKLREFKMNKQWWQGTDKDVARHINKVIRFLRKAREERENVPKAKKKKRQKAPR